jgi:hypothetical protein
MNIIAMFVFLRNIREGNVGNRFIHPLGSLNMHRFCMLPLVAFTVPTLSLSSPSSPFPPDSLGLARLLAP